MGQIITCNFKFKFGELIIGSYDNKLCLCDWKYRKMRPSIDTRLKNGLKSEYKSGKSEIIDLTISQLNEYFEGKRSEFNIPLLTVGTDFQKYVWVELLKIPYGKTESYLSLSSKIKDDKIIRAVANANGANAISILIPCHRVIGSNGDLTGYAGGISVKKKLLELEGALDKNQYSIF